MSNLFHSVSKQFLILFCLFVFLCSWSLAVTAETEITVKPGQSIIKIMRKIYPDQRSRWPQLMRELVKANPAAFENGDPRTLKVGSVIKLPEQSTAKVKKVKRIKSATVKDISGTVSLFDNKKATKNIVQGRAVFVGDQLLTSENGSVTLSFIDGAVIKLRCNSLLNIDKYKMRTRGSQSQLTLLKGSLHNKTGRIGKREADTIVLKTPMADLKAVEAEYGIRVRQAGACAEQADVENDGLFVDVLNGTVVVAAAAGELSVSSGDAAMVAANNIAPVTKQAFSGMVFGKKVVGKIADNKATTIKKNDEPEPVADKDDEIPVWWMIASALILGISF